MRVSAPRLERTTAFPLERKASDRYLSKEVMDIMATTPNQQQNPGREGGQGRDKDRQQDKGRQQDRSQQDKDRQRDKEQRPGSKSPTGGDREKVGGQH